MTITPGNEAIPVSDRIASGEPRANRALFITLLVALAWAPIPIGSNRTWSVGLLGFALLATAGLLMFEYSLRRFEISKSLKHSQFVLFSFLAWALYPLLQLVPLPIGIVEALGGSMHASYAHVPSDEYSNLAYFTVDRATTFSGFLWQLSLVAVLFSSLSLVNSRSRLRILLVTVFLVGFFEAVYGLAIYFGGDAIGLWNPGHTPHFVSGTYVNQNHFAGLMELTIPVGLGLLLCIQEEERPASRSPKSLSAVLSVISGRSGFVIFCLLVMTAALILTASRGGIGALMAGISAAICLAALKRGLKTPELKLGGLLGILVVVALLWTGPGHFPEKLREAGLSSHRSDLRETSYVIIRESPIFGTGVGTYRWVFPQFKDERFGGNFYEHAHNDFLEILSEQGAIGFSLFAVSLLLALGPPVRTYARSKDPLMWGTMFGAIAGCGSMLVHGFVDFNLQIPANAAYFFVLLSAGLIASQLDGSEDTSEDQRRKEY